MANLAKHRDELSETVKSLTDSMHSATQEISDKSEVPKKVVSFVSNPTMNTAKMQC